MTSQMRPAGWDGAIPGEGAVVLDDEGAGAPEGVRVAVLVFALDPYP
jgi:hypothetical protein